MSNKLFSLVVESTFVLKCRMSYTIIPKQTHYIKKKIKINLIQFDKSPSYIIILTSCCHFLRFYNYTKKKSLECRMGFVTNFVIVATECSTKKNVCCQNARVGFMACN
ncbi:hypothetical protein BpHYR1_029225 [Brachionus plicatilis]|uniref:Uncharacterized protein n=1 Tax=Brachionus plicatilis TaxID=10195 RepID=A0A3M7S4G6_BRAPC|nr:hypothetical protein BpHYR1_029225 [Brachionus plicatilis]